MLSQNLKLKTQNHNSNLKFDIRYRTYQFSLSVIRFAASFPEKRIYWITSDQLLRAATSVGANITEAKSSSSRKDFIRYYEIALKSANETEYWLNLLKDGPLVTQTEIETLIKEIGEISNMIGASLLTLKGKR